MLKSYDLPESVAIPILKRIFDVVCSVMLLVGFAPVMLLFGIWITLEQILRPSARGPLFYCETRMSQGRPFLLRKIRTVNMKSLEEERKRTNNVDTKRLEENPGNFTGYGRFLHKVYLDELPQLFSVLKGDLTLVGPRPTTPARNAELRELGLNTKDQMKCGLTGPYQAGKGRVRPTDYELDAEYICFVERSRSVQVVARDISIIAQTAGALWRAAGE